MFQKPTFKRSQVSKTRIYLVDSTVDISQVLVGFVVSFFYVLQSIVIFPFRLAHDGLDFVDVLVVEILESFVW